MTTRGRWFVGRTPLFAVALLAVAAVAAAATTAAPSGTPPPAASTATGKPAPSVDDIVAGYISNRGGLKKIRSIETLRQHGNATAGPGRQAVVTRELKRPNRVRFEFTMQGVTGVFASDGQRGWKVSPFDGDMTPTPLPDEVVQEAVEQADIEGPLVDWKAKGHRAELVGHEVIDGRDTYKIELTLKSGAVRHEYLEVATLHLVRSESTRTVRGVPVQIQTTFGDFRKTRGVLFPWLVEVAAAGRPQKLRIVVDKVDVNPPLDDARFEMSIASN
jgi:outer membrane lipoprotein-sorting protein